MRIGIIGAGVSGMTAAWLLKDDHQVTLLDQLRLMQLSLLDQLKLLDLILEVSWHTEGILRSPLLRDSEALRWSFLLIADGHDWRHGEIRE